MTKRIMRAFKMNEISAVDRPAQAHARAAIMKRDEGEPYWKRTFTADERRSAAASGAALPDGSFPIHTVADVKNAIHDIGRANDPAKAKAHIISRAKALGATGSLPDDWVSKGVDMTIEELKKALAEGIATATAEITKQLKDATDKIAKLEKAGKTKKPFDNSDENEPDADDDTKKAWRAYCAKQVQKAVEDALAKQADVTKSDETISVGGETIVKSVVGEAVFKAFKVQADAIAKAADAAEVVTFEKAAEKDYGSLPGKTVEKASALRAVSKLAKADREAVEVMLKAGEKAMAQVLTEKGRGGGVPVDSAQGKLDALAKALQDEVQKSGKRITAAEAMTKVLDTDEGKRLYRESLTEPKAA